NIKSKTRQGLVSTTAREKIFLRADTSSVVQNLQAGSLSCMALVCVTIVAHNSSQYLESCLRSVLRQTHHPLEVVVVDNASPDGTRQVLARFEECIRVIHNRRNVGFAAAQNQAIASSVSDWVLALNPDAKLLPGFVQQLVEGAQIDDCVGTVCGRLLSASPD